MTFEPRRLRLLVLTSTYPRWPGDHEPGFVHELARRLTADFEVTVLAPSDPGAKRYERMDGVEIFRFRYAPKPLETLVNNGGIAANLARSPWKWLLVPWFLLGQFLEARRLLRVRDIDLMHVHWIVPQGLVALALTISGGRRVPYVVTSHGGDLFAFRGRLALALKRKVISRAAMTTVVSRAAAAEATRLGVEPQCLSIVPMGADLQGRFTPGDARRSASGLLFVGRLVEKKGLRYLIEAMPEVLEKHPDATLDIAGFGPLENELKAAVAARGLDGKVRFMGAVPQDRLPELYRRAAVVVAPFVRASSGDEEGLPVVLMEAIGCGCPVIAGDVAGARELLGDEDDAIVPAGDARALAEAICALLGGPALARELAQRLRQRCLNLDWGSIASQYSQLLLKSAGQLTTSQS